MTELDLKTKAPNDAKPLLQAVRVLNLYACLGGNRYSLGVTNIICIFAL